MQSNVLHFKRHFNIFVEPNVELRRGLILYRAIHWTSGRENCQHLTSEFEYFWKQFNENSVGTFKLRSQVWNWSESLVLRFLSWAKVQRRTFNLASLASSWSHRWFDGKIMRKKNNYNRNEIFTYKKIPQNP